eukprot:8318575-Lingulodinium_polyedra.AAC.1
MSGAAAWIAQRGAPHGPRPPALGGRASTTGAAAHLESLKQPGCALYDAGPVRRVRTARPARLS